MAERDRFELDLAAALDAYLEDAPTEVWPTELARQVATAHPRGRRASGHWGFRLAPRVAWALLLVALLASVVAGMLAVGSRLPELRPALVPATVEPSPTASPMTADGLTHAPGRATDEVGDATGADIVAVTTRTTAGELVLEVELADSWPSAGSAASLLRVRLNPDRHATCNPWLSTYILDVAGGGETSTAEATLRYQPFTGFGRWWGTPGRPTPATYDIGSRIDGPRLTLAVPLEYLADSETVGFRLFTSLDEFPSGWGGGTGCYEVAIAPGDVEN